MSVNDMKLEPCPFCASSNLEYEFSSSQGYIKCNDCGVFGPEHPLAADPHCDVHAAELIWNRRALRACKGNVADMTEASFHINLARPIFLAEFNYINALLASYNYSKKKPYKISNILQKRIIATRKIAQAARAIEKEGG